MANALLHNVMRKLPASSLAARHEELENYRRAVNQERHDTNKIYSLHEPDVLCVSKGKEHKKYEFGAKAAIAMTKRIGATAIVLPAASPPSASAYDKRKARKNFGRRSAIEPVIGHLKNSFRLARNYLKGTIGDAINLLLAAAAFNCRKPKASFLRSYSCVVCAIRKNAKFFTDVHKAFLERFQNEIALAAARSIAARPCGSR